jgi:hypothetical protein
MTNLILIDSRILGKDDIISSLTLDTESMVFDIWADTFESIQRRIQKPYASVAIAQHNYASPTYAMTCSMEPAFLEDIINTDPELTTWSKFIEFLQWLKNNGATNVDLLACNLWANSNWVFVIEQMRSRLGLTIRASVDITGKDGNFVLESDNVDMIGIYFTEGILQYKHNFYVSHITTFGGNNSSYQRAYLGYSSYSFPASSPGYIPVSAYTNLFGGASTNNGTDYVPLTTDVSNISTIAINDQAIAILKTDGTVVCFGSKLFGGDCSAISSELYNITKIIGAGSGGNTFSSSIGWFVALRADKKVFCWGQSGGRIDGGDYYDFVLVRDRLIDVVDIYTSPGASFALLKNGTIVGWGGSGALQDSRNFTNSNIVKLFMDNGSWGVAMKKDGNAYPLKGDPAGIGSPNPVIDILHNSNLIYVKSTSNNTIQFVGAYGAQILYEFPDDMWVVSRFGLGWYDYILLSDGTVLKLAGGSGGVFRTSVMQMVTDGISIVMLKLDGTLLLYTPNGSGGGDVGEPVFLTEPSNTNRGVPPGVTLTNIKKIFATTGSFAALKNDNTFVVWGGISDSTLLPSGWAYPATLPTTHPTFYNAISTNVKEVYSYPRGFVLIKTDESIFRIGPSNWYQGSSFRVLPTTSYGTKRAGKNLWFGVFGGCLPIEVTPTVSYTISQYMQYLPTTVKYYNNTPELMPVIGRRYSLMNGSTLIKHFVCQEHYSAYTFTDLVFTQEGALNLSIWDTTITPSVLVVNFPTPTNIISNPSVSAPDAPTITNVAVGTKQLTITFQAPVWNGGLSLLKYRYSLNKGNTYTDLSVSSTQLLLTGLTDSSYTIWIVSTNYMGDSYYAETSTAMFSPPLAPTISSVVSGNQQAVLNVSTSNNGGGAITGYKYAFSYAGPYTSFAVNPSGGTTAATAYTITGLLNGTAYSLYVKATNGAGDSPVTTFGPFTPPKLVPNSPVITSVVPGNTSIKVIFTAPYNGGSVITGYKYILNNSISDAAAVTATVVDSSFVITGLTNGTTYTVKMQAVNAIGTSVSSGVSSAVVPKTVPSAPTISSVTAGNQQLLVAFIAPVSTGGAEITKYNYRLNGGSPVALSNFTSPFTITGLTNGISYTLTMSSVTIAGESALSVASAAVIPATVPSAPIIQSIVAGNQSITVNFTVDNGGRPLTLLEYSLNDASNVSVTPTSSPLVINGLTNGTDYRVQLQVSSQNGTSSMSEYSEYVTPKTVPSAPSIDSIEAGNRYIEFAFSPPLDDGSSPITGYKYSINGSVFSAIGLVQSPYRINQNINNGTSYSVRLIATNTVGDSAVSVVSNSVVPCKVPEPPSIVSVQNADKQVTIQLSPGNNGGSEILSYAYSVGDASAVIITSLSSPLVFDNLDIGTVYNFQIRATNLVGDSIAITANFTGMSVPDAPVIMSATAGNKMIILEFSPPNANSSLITGYKYSISEGTYLPANLVDSTHISITGLSANTEYNVKLVAVNVIGQSIDSEPATANPYTNPLAPTIGLITVDNGSASIDFSPQSDNGSIITEHEYSLNNGSYIAYPSVESPLVLSDLSNGVAYTVKIKAKNAAGASIVASSASFMPRTIPDAPVITSVTSGNESCEVGFTPGFFNGAVITKYRYSLNNANDFQDANGTVSPITINGLTNGNTYMVYLLAVNQVGESTISVPSSAFVPFVTQSTPNPPTDLVVIAGNASVTVHFTDGVNLGSAIKGYMYSVDGGETRWWAKQPESPLTIVGLENGLEQSIQLRAVNNSGPSGWSVASELFTPCTLPDAPILTGVRGGDERIVVSFLPGSYDGGVEVSSYEYSLDAGITYSELSADSTIYGLNNGTSYHVKLRAVNLVGSSLSSASSSAVIPYKPPSSPIIASVVGGDQSIVVAFTPGNTNGSIVSRYEYAFVSDEVVGAFNIATSIGSPIIINGLDNGTGYRVVLRAVSSLGEYSEESNMSNEVFPGTVPTTPIITKLIPGNSSITVNWVANMNGSALTNVLYNLNDGPYVDAETTTESFTIDELINGAAYSIRVIAVNTHGPSPPSSISDSITPFSKPEPPTVTSVVPGDSKAQIFLTPGDSNGSNVIGYKYSLDGTSYQWVKENTSPISIYGLNNGANYNIYLETVGENVGESSSVALTSSVMPYRSPDAPVIKSISVGNGSAVITFVDGSSNGLALTGYQYSLDASNYMDISAVNQTITLEGLTNGSTYTVSLKSVSAVSTSAPSVISALFMPYTDPSPPVISRIVTGDQTASVYIVDGSLNGSGSIQAYRYTFDNTTFYWASSSASPIVISSGLVNNQGYRISVATKTSLGMSAYSSQSPTFVPYTLPGPPTITSVIAGSGVASINFTDGSSNGRPISKYQYTINGVSYPEVTGTSPLPLTGLTNGTSYTVTLKNANLAGYSPASLASNVFTPFTVPSAPTITNLVPLANQITVYVSPGNTNGSAITQYAYSLNNGAYVSMTNAALSFVITGLTNGTSYTVAVKAENAAGVGAASATSAGVVPFTVPNAPTITGVTVGNGSAVVAITNGNNNGSIATQYQYTYTSSAGSTTLTTSTSATQLTSIPITGLTNWTNYTVSVKAINAAGMSLASVVSSSFMPFNIPGAPVIANVVPGNASITVNMDGLTIGAGVVGYKYSFDNATYTYKSGGGSSFSITGLVNATSYQVYVKSVTPQGDSPVSMPSSVVVPFHVPNVPTITSVVSGNRTVSIYVLDGSNNGRSVINYEYSTDGMKYNVVDPVSPIVLNNLTNWQSYFYYVRSVNAAGSSLPSEQSVSVIPFLVPTSASIVNTIPGDCQITVEMDGYTPDSGIIGYKYLLDNSGDLVFVPSASASFTITRLVNGQDYIINAKSCTSAGDSPLSNASLPVHPRAVPSLPTNVVVTPLNESAIVTFVDGSANGEVIQYYMYSLNGEVDTPIKKREDGTLKIFGISNAIDYSIRLRAVNSAGLSPYAEVSNTFMPYGPPIVMPVVTKILPGNGCVYVYFSEADTNGSPLTKFKWTDGTKTFDVSGVTSPLIISGLANKKPLTIAICSCNLVGDSPFTPAKTMVPGVPLEPVVTDVVALPGKLLVYFDVPENNGFPITSYLYGFVGSPAFVKGSPASTTSVSPLAVLNLKNGTPYNVALMASNLNGNSVVSNSVGNRIPCAPPVKVVIASVSSRIDGALVTFTPPANNGAPILGYKYALNGSTTYTYVDASGLTLPLRIDGTLPNTVNTVSIIATNLAGDSIVSAASKPFTFVYLPPAQIKVTGLTIGLNRLTVAFLPPAINGSPIIGYKYALNGSTEYIDASSTTLPLVITDDILPNMLYNIRVIAVNGAGSSIPSLPVAKPVTFVYLPPLAPTIANIVAGNQSALVTFTGLPARGSPITGYAYTFDASATTIYDVSGAVSPLAILELTNDTLYNVRIAAITPAGYSAWSVMKPVTPVYKVPDKPIITKVVAGNEKLTIEFTAPAANGSPIFMYKYALGSGDKVEIASIVGGKSFVITGLTNGTVYNVFMCATNILGDSELSLGKPGTPKS